MSVCVCVSLLWLCVYYSVQCVCDIDKCAMILLLIYYYNNVMCQYNIIVCVMCNTCVCGINAILSNQ